MHETGLRRLFLALLVTANVMGAISDHAMADPVRRVPAEWEPQEAIWLQWPRHWERSHETAFARISNVIARYETLHILHASAKIRADARAAIGREGGDPDHPDINESGVSREMDESATSTVSPSSAS